MRIPTSYKGKQEMALSLSWRFNHVFLLATTILALMSHAANGHDDEENVHINDVSRTGVPKKPRKPDFQPGPWCKAHATFYEGSPTSFGGACGYEDVQKLGYGQNTAALSVALWNGGQKCGACYEIHCDCAADPKWCKAGHAPLVVTATDQCPGGTGGWCDAPKEHFDIAKPAFAQIAQYEGGVVPVEYRRVPCKRQGGMRFTITGNPWFNLVSITNVGGAGDIQCVFVQHEKLPWAPLKRNWGQKWQSDCKLVGEELSFRVQTGDGKSSVAVRVFPKNWQFGQTYESKKNFK